ncbi:regulator of CtrA degradation [Sphingomonas rubra]|uniref:Regulator of CtrA degradation n=2 Tax=Sphingomonas rubra TaxID=634430 RepID=A0A1I5RXF8_9SPHN|nr:regulator of CtrA degradation [Sphingomonas rubra]
MGQGRESTMYGRVVDALYVDAMLLADEARSYFEEQGRAEREALSPNDRVAFSCESLHVTTRLMHVVAWLLTRRAVDAGELSATGALDPARRLASAPRPLASLIAALPARAAALVTASADLHRRAAVLDEAFAADRPPSSPARSMQQRLVALL